MSTMDERNASACFLPSLSFEGCTFTTHKFARRSNSAITAASSALLPTHATWTSCRSSRERSQGTSARTGFLLGISVTPNQRDEKSQQALLSQEEWTDEVSSKIEIELVQSKESL